jgi:DNA-directed RNA polymerase subunit RPC12/RpoP
MRYTIKTAKKLFLENQCELLEDSYKNSSTSMRYICKCGSKSNVALSDFKRGNRCRECGNKKATVSRHNKINNKENVKEYFEKEGCKLLNEYSSYSAPLKYICKCGKRGETIWHNFKLGIRCGYCSKRRSKKYDIEEVKEIFKEGGCKLLQDHYENSNALMKYECSCGETSVINLQNFIGGSRCKQCGLEKNIGKNNHRWIKDREKKKENDLFRNKCIGMLHKSLNAINKKKKNRTHKLLGYTPIQLQNHIKQHPNWDNVKDGSWHLDHIFPIKAFVDHDIKDIKLINSLSNLQPLSQKENNEKSSKYDKKLFSEWLKSMA